MIVFGIYVVLLEHLQCFTFFIVQELFKTGRYFYSYIADGGGQGAVAKRTECQQSNTIFVARFEWVTFRFATHSLTVQSIHHFLEVSTTGHNRTLFYVSTPRTAPHVTVLY